MGVVLSLSISSSRKGLFKNWVAKSIGIVEGWGKSLSRKLTLSAEAGMLICCVVLGLWVLQFNWSISCSVSWCSCADCMLLISYGQRPVQQWVIEVSRSSFLDLSLLQQTSTKHKRLRDIWTKIEGNEMNANLGSNQGFEHENAIWSCARPARVNVKTLLDPVPVQHLALAWTTLLAGFFLFCSG